MSDTINTSFYAKPPAPVNPLEMMGQVAGIQNAMNQNRQFQLEIGAKQAMGPIMQEAIDPQTGQLDQNKVAVLMAKNPATAFKVPEYVQMLAQNRKLDAETVQTHAKTAIDQAKYLQDQYAALAGLGLNITNENIEDMTIRSVQAGAVPVSMATAFLQTMPKSQILTGPDGKRYNPAAIWVQQNMLATAEGAARLNSFFGPITAHDMGGSTVFTQPNNILGTNTSPAGLPQLQQTSTVAQQIEPHTVIPPGSLTTESIPTGALYGGGANMPQGVPNPAVGGGGAAPLNMMPNGAAPPSGGGAMPQGGGGLPAGGAAPAPNSGPPARPFSYGRTANTPEDISAIQAFTEHEKDLTEAQPTARLQLQVINLLQTLKDAAQPGGGWARETMASIGQSLYKSSIPLFSRAGKQLLQGDPSAVVESIKLLTQQAFGGIKTQLPGGEHAAETINAYVEKGMPNIGTEAKAYDQMLKYLKNVSLQPIAEKFALDQARSKGQLDPRSWTSDWGKMLMKDFKWLTPGTEPGEEVEHIVNQYKIR